MRYKTELEESRIYEIHSEACETYEAETGNTNLSEINRGAALALYALIREERPDLVVETGVAHGFSSLIILKALERNAHGLLHSVDVPYQKVNSNPDSIDLDHKEFVERKLRIDPTDKQVQERPNTFLAGRNPGWMVPDRLRDRWTLHLGRSQRILPKLTGEIQSPDIFIHDSDHSPPCQFFEYELALEWLSDPGIILSDDISEPFKTFTEYRPIQSSGRLTTNFAYMKV